MAYKTGALATKDLERVAVDTTVQPKAVAFPTDARLMHKAIVMLGREARKHDVPLRQSYVRVAKRAALMAGRYAHAKQFKRHNRELKFLRTRLGRVTRDIRRKIDSDEALKAIFAVPLSRADQVRRQRQRQRGWKLYSLHAPEVECIGNGKARAPYEFGCKVSVATPVTQPKGGQFVLHAKALHGNPYDGHTLGPVVAEMEKLTGVEARRIHVDKGYRGHNHPHRFRVWISGQVRRVIVRHGYLPVPEVQTGIGPIAVRRPRVRDRHPTAGDGHIRFTSAILPPYRRRAKSLEELLPWLYLKGISTLNLSPSWVRFSTKS